MAKKYFSSAQDTLETKIQEQPENANLYRSLGIAYAGLGLKEDAIRAGKRGAELLPVAKNPWRGTFPVEDLARIYVMVGKYDAAIDQIKFLLSVHGRLSIHLLKLDPAWDPLRDHPRFKMLIEAGK